MKTKAFTKQYLQHDSNFVKNTSQENYQNVNNGELWSAWIIHNFCFVCAFLHFPNILQQVYYLLCSLNKNKQMLQKWHGSLVTWWLITYASVLILFCILLEVRIFIKFPLSYFSFHLPHP